MSKKKKQEIPKNYKNTGPGKPFKISQKVADCIPELLSTSQLARLLRVSRTIMAQWVKHSEFQSFFEPRSPFGRARIVDRCGFLYWARKTGRFDGEIRHIEWIKERGYWDYERNEVTREYVEVIEPELIRQSKEAEEQLARRPPPHEVEIPADELPPPPDRGEIEENEASS
jgi:hypothetical protein